MIKEYIDIWKVTHKFSIEKQETKDRWLRRMIKSAKEKKVKTRKHIKF